MVSAPLPCVTLLDAKLQTKQSCHQSWQNEWDDPIHSSNKLKSVKNHIEHWSTSHNTERLNEIILTRLRIGHTRITHGHLMNREPPPICDNCQTPLTVKHILLDCQKYTIQRQILTTSALPTLLGNDSTQTEQLLKFIHNSNLTHSI